MRSPADYFKTGRPPAWLVFCILFVISLLTYANSLRNEFMIDDFGLIFGPTATVTHHPKHLLSVITRADHADTFSLGHYRPVSDVFRVLLYYFLRDNGVGYHLVNIVLFAAFAALAFFFILSLTGSMTLGFWTSILFTVHPINTMAVNYITAHEVILYGIFALASLIAFNRFLQEGGRRWYGISLTFFVLSFLTQELMVMLPAYLALMFVYDKGKRVKEAALTVFPYIGIAFLYVAWRMQFASIKANLIDNIVSADMSLLQYAATLSALIGWYISKLIFPHQIVFLWNTQPLTGSALWAGVAVGILLVACLIVFFRKFDRLGRLALSFFLLGLAPVSILCFIYRPMGLIIEPHWFFVASLGFFLGIAIVFNRCKKRLGRVALFSFWIVAGLWMFATTQYNALWRTQKTYCRYWLEIAPDNHGPNFWMAHSYMEEGNFPLAREYFRRALVGGFMDWQVYANWGLMAYMEGDGQKALQEYAKAASLYPRSGVIHNNVGLVFKERGEWEAAEKAFQNAIQDEPFLIEPRLNLSQVYVATGQMEKALALLKENFELDPYHEHNLYALAKLYAEGNDLQGLKSILPPLLKYGNNAIELIFVANQLAQSQLYKDAPPFYEKAMRLDPRHKTVYLELGKFLGNTGRLQQAIVVWEQGIAVAGAEDEFTALIEQARRIIAEEKK